MRLFSAGAALYAACFAFPTMAADVPAGSVGACPAQGCENCPRVQSANEGFPHCITYNSAQTLGQNYAPSGGGNGYDVWWQSGAPNPSCKIIVRTPATTDLPACGYFLTSWAHAGCYYTAIQDTFMLQYCCGTGDCNAASPAQSVAHAHSQAKLGNTTIVSLKLGDTGGSGKREIEGIGEVAWKRSDFAYSKRTDISDSEPSRRKCAFHPTSGMTTEGGQQVKASDTQVCNTQGGCAFSKSVGITEGQTISPTLNFATVFGVVGSAVGYTFMESKTYTVTTTYTQKQGTTGYLSYIPTLNCWDGTFSDCRDRVGDNIRKIDPNQVFHACTPAQRSGGSIDGTFSFVYSH